MIKRVPAWGLVVTGCVSIQFGAALAATIFDDLGPSGVSLLRLGFAAVVLLAIWRPDPRAHPAADLRLAGLFGLTLGTMNLLFYEALDRIPLGVAVTIEFAGPLAVGVLGSRKRSDLVWAALAAVGIVLLAGASGSGTGGGALDRTGVAFALGAAACWGLYIVIAQRAGRVFESGSGLALASVVAALVPVGPGLAEGGSDLLRPEILLVGLAVALASSVIPYSLEFEALRRLRANVFGVLMSLEPALAALAGFIVLGQALSARDLVAMALVVTASVGVARGSTGPPPIDAA